MTALVDPEFLARLESRASPLVLREGEMKTLSLKPTDPPVSAPRNRQWWQIF